MKICIVTLPIHTNYGGILQTYALQLTLRRMGHEATTIRKKRVKIKLPIWKAIPVWLKRSYKKFILKNKDQIIFFEKKINTEYSIINKYTDVFIKKHIRIKEVTDFQDIKENDFNCYIVGSDQVWRPQYFDSNITDAYLAFTDNWPVKRLAYAPSFGTDIWEYSKEKSDACSHLIKNFDDVSVREMSGRKLCAEHLQYNSATHVLDPTMLLSVEDYLKLIPYKEGNQTRGLLTYILDEDKDKEEIIKAITEEKNIHPFSVITKQEVLTAPIKDRIALPVEDWLQGFYDAKFVFTDSFHACIFSILFHKPFFVFGNKARGLSRFQSLLSIFELEDRLIQSEADFQELKDRQIDWNHIDEILERHKDYSMNFLSKNLRDRNVSNT